MARASTIRRPTVFVGSSSEGVRIAKAVQRALDGVADVALWNQGVFELNLSYLESLLKATESVDFAVLVLTPDDLIQSREEQTESPRDNVIFELGLFMGRLGRDRCFFLYDRADALKLPTDLLGISPATYRQHADRNLDAAIGVACSRIEERIREKGTRPRLLNSYVTSSRLGAVHGDWKGTALQDCGPDGEPITAEVSASFDARNAQVVGVGTFRFKRRNGEMLEANYRFNGGFLFDQFLRFEYDRIDPERIQFGSVILALEPNAESMCGRFHGYGMESKQIVHGSIEIRRA